MNTVNLQMHQIFLTIQVWISPFRILKPKTIFYQSSKLRFPKYAFVYLFLFFKHASSSERNCVGKYKKLAYLRLKITMSITIFERIGIAFLLT